MTTREQDEATIHSNLLRLANGDRDLALQFAVKAIDYYRCRSSAGFIYEDPAHSVRPPKEQPEPILTSGGD